MNANYILDNLYLFIISTVIVIIQLTIYLSTCKKISLINGILENWNYYRILRKTNSESEEDTVTGIVITEGEHRMKYENEVTDEIEKSITTYLLRNKGAVSDFNLIKDIVERNCDTKVAEVEAQTSMPLYIGLIGTVAGIVLGLSSLALRGESLGDPSSIMSLMVGVAFAMIASGMGVVFTSLSIWKSKKCSATLERNKNKFYTWIQTELLPIISSNTVSTLSLLQRNLHSFNNSFAKIVKQLDEKLTGVGDLYSSQIELLDRIEKIDIYKMATANIRILETLTRSADKLDSFAKYMDQTTEYLSTVRELNEKLDEHLGRTDALAVISDFYKRQMNEIELRQNAIKSVATDVDNVVKKAFVDLEQNTRKGMEGLQAVYTKQTEIMTTMAVEQGNALNGTINKLNAMINLSEQLLRMPKIVEELSRNAATQTEATLELAKSVRKLQIKKNGVGWSFKEYLHTKWLSISSFVKRKTGRDSTNNKSHNVRKDSTHEEKKNFSKPYNPRTINRIK